MATKKAAVNDVKLPFPALQLLAPPVRLVSAAVWKVLKQRDVAHYGAVEEFVTSVCESVPGMLTFRHQGKLTLGLRGRLILELLSCSQDQPDRELINLHLERFRAPTPCPTAHKVKKDVKIERTVSSFQEMVETLLHDPDERLLFFKEEFPEEYGPKFDQELEKLLWEFLIRLDQLLPVPNLAQTVSWLSAAPPVLEECARAASQPQLLKTILQYQTCLGHLEAAASLPPNMGDSILTSLSLPPSGKASSDRTPLIAPVIGLISNEDVPAMISARKKEKEEGAAKTKVRNGAKRKKPADSEEGGMDEGVEEEEEEEEEEGVDSKEGGTDEEEEEEEEEDDDDDDDDGWPAGRSTLKRKTTTTTRRRSLKKRSLRENIPQRLSEDSELDEGSDATGPSPVAIVPLRPDIASCLLHQPKVLLRRLSFAANVEGARSVRVRSGVNDDDDDGGGGGGGARGSGVDVRAKNSEGKRRKRATGTGTSKENWPLLPSISSYPTMTEAHPTPTDSNDIIADSEDEATANSKGMLFVKHYYKTKRNTYVPTLREFWKPWMANPNVLSPR